MKRLLVGSVLSCLCGLAFAAESKWQADGSGVYDGVFNDPAHWTAGVPGGESALDARFDVNGTYTVSAPENGYEFKNSRLWVDVKKNQTLTFDTRGGFLTLGEYVGGIGTSFPLLTQFYGTGYSAGRLLGVKMVDSPSAADKLGPFYTLSNAVMRLVNEDSSVSLHLDSGLFDALDVNGVRRPYLLQAFFYGDGQSKSFQDGYLKFHAGSQLRCAKFQHMGRTGGQARISFDGGEHWVDGAFAFENNVKGAGTNALDVTGGAKVRLGSVSLTYTGEGRVDEVNVSGAGSELTVAGDYALSTVKTEIHTRITDGATATFGGKFDVGAVNSQEAISSHVEIADATVHFGTVNIGIAGAGAANQVNDFTVRNATVDSTGTLTHYVGHTVLSNSTVTLAGLTAVRGRNQVGPRPLFEVLGGNLEVNGTTYVGDSGNGGSNASGDGTLRICGGSHWFHGGNFRIMNGDNKGGCTSTFLVDGPDTFVRIEPTGTPRVSTAASNVGRFVVSNGVADVSATGASDFFRLGWKTWSTGVVEVAGGALYVTNKCARIDSHAGCGQIRVGGGLLVAKAIWLGEHVGSGSETTTPGDVDTSESSITVSGGRLQLMTAAAADAAKPENSGIVVSQQPNRRGRVTLTGGTVSANYIRANGTDSVFEADGATVDVSGATVTATGDKRFDLISGFGTATLGEKGLTIVSDAAFDLGQAFDDASGEEGLLTLVGTAARRTTKAFNASRLVVAGGLLDFSGADAAVGAAAVVITNGASVAFNGQATGLASLMLGDATTFGQLVIQKGETVVVNGDVSLGNVRLALGAGFENATTSTILRVTGTVTGVDNWTMAMVSSGVPAGSDYNLDIVENEGVKELRLAFVTATPIEVTVDPGETKAMSGGIVYGASRTLVADVGSEGSLEISGQVSGGSLVKSGSGVLHLTNDGNRFFGDLACEGGLFSASPLAALGYTTLGLGRFRLEDGTLELGGPDGARFGYDLTIANPVDANGIIIKTDADVAMAAPTIESGVLVKRGAGSLTLEVSGTKDCTASCGAGVSSGAPAWPAGGLVFDEFGTVPDVPWGALNVVEGNLLLRGLGADATFKTQVPVYVGVPSKGAADASLTVDGLTFDATTFKTGGLHFYLAPKCTADASDSGSPSVVLTNGAALKVTTFRVATDAGKNENLHPRVVADGGSTLVVNEYLRPNEGAADVTFAFDHGSTLAVDASGLHALAFETTKPCSFLFDNGSLFCGLNGGFGKIAITGGAGSADYLFAAGSEFRCNRIVVDTKTAYTQTFAFDGGVWNPGDGDFDFTFPGVSNMIVRATGDGLVLEPSAGRTYRVSMPVTGEGPVRVAGDGRVLFSFVRNAVEKYNGHVVNPANSVTNLCPDAANPAPAFQCGGLVLASGTAEFETGAAPQGLSVNVTGDATLKSSALDAPTFAVAEGQTLALDGCAFTGRVKVDFVGRTFALGDTVPVFTYTGTAPDVSTWRAINVTGAEPMRGRLVAKDGVISLEAVPPPGVLLIVR